MPPLCGSLMPVTAIGKLQTIQNAAMRIATGCLRMSSLDHLHRETKLLPVASSLSLLCKQYLLSALRPGHPAERSVNLPPSRRNIKHTLSSRFRNSIDHLLTDGVVPAAEYRPGLRRLHTAAVEDALRTAALNRVLGTPPPEVDLSELSLPRPTRSALAQLRSGFCSSLESYRFRIGISPNECCPECQQSPHDVAHIFECPTHPTPLTVSSLWDDPVAVAGHLSSLPSFPFVVPLPRPPPEPPPT